jgi:hypothetical protein
MCKGVLSFSDRQNGRLADNFPNDTLRGPDVVAGPGGDNQRPGVMVGQSYISFTPNAGSGVQTPLDPVPVG